MSQPPLPVPPALPSWLSNYAPPAGRFDECLAPDGSLRGPWTDFFAQLGDDPTATLRAASDACHRAIIEQEVNVNVYEDARSAAQSWPLDVIPLLLDRDSWHDLSTGLQQRAQLYERLLKDLYGPQHLLKSGSIPAALAMANPNFLRACAGLGERSTPFLQNFAVDVARSPDGRWWVLEDRLDAPAGLGYALQNRIIIRHVLAGAFRETPVVRLYQFLQDYRNALSRLATDPQDPRIVLLTPGPANEAYFEHTYLARYLGCAPVEGEDLTTRDQQVYLRTVGGLKRVDAILRRVDSEFCDPLELNPESLLGIPGLVQAAQAGTVGLANQLGGTALEGTGLLAYLPPLCRELLGEKLLLPSAATWWCGEPSAREYVLKNLHALVIKPTFGGRFAFPTRYGKLLSAAEREVLAAQIRALPHAYCGQERVLLGTTPTWEKDRLRPKPYVLRVYLSWCDGKYQVLPGGLARFNWSGEDGIISLQRGSVSKDTWVLQEGAPVERPVVTLPVRRDFTLAPTATPSRLADHLYWLGRYLERTRQISRLVEKMEGLIEDEIAALDPGVATDMVRLTLRLQDSNALGTAPLDFLVNKVHRIAADGTHVGSLAGNLRELSRILEIAKVHLPPEAWQTARKLRTLTPSPTQTGVWPELRTQLSALDSLAAETLPRDTGWRFLDLGRRVERAMQLLFCIEAFLPAQPALVVTEFRLQTLLHVTDGLFTYRSIYHGPYQNAPVLACLFGAAENPRSVCYQTDRIYEHLQLLPEEIAPAAVATLRSVAYELAKEIRLADVQVMGEEPAQIAIQIRAWIGRLSQISDTVTRIYFAHLQQA